jgi:hypothetical protein
MKQAQVFEVKSSFLTSQVAVFGRSTKTEEFQQKSDGSFERIFLQPSGVNVISYFFTRHWRQNEAKYCPLQFLFNFILKLYLHWRSLVRKCSSLIMT